MQCKRFAGLRVSSRRKDNGFNGVKVNDRPHPDPLPQEREQPQHAHRSSNGYSTNPALGSRKRLEAILLLLGEKAGMRADYLTNFKNRFQASSLLHRCSLDRTPKNLS